MEPHQDELHDQASLYVVGALSPSERETFERHLASCARCRDEVASLGPVADLLVYAVPQHNPPLDLRGRVLAAATPPAAATPRPALAVMPWLLAAASLVIAVSLGAYALQLRGRVDALGAQLRAAMDNAASLERQLTDVQRTAVRAQLVAAVISAPDLARIDLAGQKTAPRAAARAFWSDSRDTLVFNASNLPPLAPGRTYQVWVIPPGQGAMPISAGLIAPDPEGRAEAVVPTPPGMPPPSVVAVTDEPAGGSQGPTTMPFLVGQAGRSAL
jgi:anti-sigma-K factor RskA